MAQQLTLAAADVTGQFADKKLQRIAEETNITKDMVEFFKTQQCDTIAKVAVVCTEEKEVRTTLIEGMNSAKSDMCKTLGEQAAVKLFWHRCRTEWAKAGAAEDVSAPAECLTIPDRDTRSMVSLWADRHNYVLPDCHMLVASRHVGHNDTVRC